MLSITPTLAFVAFASLAVASSSSGPSRMDRVSADSNSKRQLPSDKPICVEIVPVNTGAGSPGTAQAIKRDCSLININTTPATAKNATIAGQTITRRQANSTMPTLAVGVIGADASGNEVDLLKKRTLLCAEFSGLNANNANILQMKRAAGCDNDVNTTAATADDTVVKGPPSN